LYDCGSSRDGTGYQDVTDSTDPEVLAIKRQFDEILATKPAPLLPADGPLGAAKTAKKRRSKRAAKK
jgi:hypothetical protein